MSFLPWHSPQADRSEERSFEALLDGAPLPPDASAEGRFLADVVDALTAPAAAGELAGLELVRAAYARQFAVPRRHAGTVRERSPLRSALSHPKIATALAAGVLGLGGFGAAAYAGTLPEAAQQVAHDVLGAPEGRSEHPGAGSASRPGGPPSSAAPTAGPDATGPAAFGLCSAWSHADASSRDSVAFANLAAAAGGADKVAAYCAGVAHPGAASHPAGLPSGVPGPSDHPGGKPSTLPSHQAGKPSRVPARRTTRAASPARCPRTRPASRAGCPARRTTRVASPARCPRTRPASRAPFLRRRVTTPVSDSPELLAGVGDHRPVAVAEAGSTT